MTNDQNPAGGPQLRSGPMIVSAALVGGGSLLAAAGIAVGGVYFVSAIRRWVKAMEVPPSELARIRWAQAREAVLAGADAWQKASGNRRAQAV
jgi:hypothetical protein